MKHPLQKKIPFNFSKKIFNKKTKVFNIIKANPLKAVLVFLWFLQMNSISFAQAPDWVWAKSIGTSAEEYAYDMANDAEGNLFVCGFFFGPSITFGNTTLNNTGDWNFFVVKYDPSGNVLWAKNPDGTSEAAAGSVAIDALGNVYVTGSFWGDSLTIGDTTLMNINYSAYQDNSDIFIIKYDPLGNVLWAKRMGGSKSEVGWSIAVDAFDNILLTGWFTSPDAAFDSIILVSQESDPNAIGDAYFAKLNSDGKVLWVKGGGTTGYDDIANSITGDKYGNIYVVGNFAGPSITWDSLTLNSVQTGYYDIFLIKLDSAGNITWLKGAAGSNDDNGMGITSDPFGNVFITGFFKSNLLDFGNISLTNSYSGTSDWYIAKYDSTGNVLWANNAKGSGDERDWRAVTCDSTGNVYSVGEYNSGILTFDSVPYITNAGYLDLFVVKYTGSGVVVWVRNAGGDSNDEPTGISVFGDDNVYVTGCMGSTTISFGNTNLMSEGGLDFFIAKIGDSNVGFEEITSKNEIAIYPNPTSDKITLSFSSNERGELRILNLLGQTVFSKQINSSMEEIDVSKFENGIYLITVASATRKFESRFLKE